MLEDGHEGVSYERLEFLGDSVVGLVVAEEAYRRFGDIDEGGLTRIKIAVVSGESLSAVASKLGVDDLIVFGFSEAGTGRRGLKSALENVYESLTGALYLDAGLEVAREWVLRTLGPSISADHAIALESPKSVLQEVLQSHKTAPEYEIVAEDGPPHDRVFTAEASAMGEILGTGQGRTKKEAEAHAAAAALELLHEREEAGEPLVAASAAGGRGETHAS